MMKKIKKNRGFVILFAVTIAAILLAIALGVANIAFREIKFSTSVKDSNEAFFAADTGVECAFFNDKSPSLFPLSGPAVTITCASKTITPTFSGTSNTGLYSFIITDLGSTNGCAKVSVTKDNTNPATIITTIISKGYNVGDGSCNSTNPNRVERELKTTYGGSALPPPPVGQYDNITNIRIVVNNSLASFSRIVEIEAWGGGTNYAQSGTAVASSEHVSGNFPASSVINGDRRGVGWGSSTGGWNDNTSDIWPDSVTITFSGPKTLNEIDVYTLANAFPLGSDPSSSDTFTLYGITGFSVQYSKDNGVSWTDAPGSPVAGNNLIWRKFTLQ